MMVNIAHKFSDDDFKAAQKFLDSFNKEKLRV